jgi:hypothetical protein
VRESAQSYEPPGQFSICGNFQVRDARRRAPIWPGDATRIQEKDPIQSLIPRHVGMPVQDHIDILGRPFRWNVDEAKPEAVSFQVDRKGPFENAVAISSHDGDGRSERLNCLENSRVADITEMPDLIRIRGQRLEFCGQSIVGIGKDEDSHEIMVDRPLRGRLLALLTNIERRSARSTNCLRVESQTFFFR